MILKRGTLAYVVTDGELESELGQTDHCRHCITLDTRMVEQARKLTLVHEALHAFAPWLEEKEVEQLTAPIYQLIAENPALTKYLQHG